jgi:hypothetical protein
MNVPCSIDTYALTIAAAAAARNAEQTYRLRKAALQPKLVDSLQR